MLQKDIKQIKLIPFEGNKDCDNRVLGYRGRKEGMGLAAVAVAVAVVVVVVVRERRRKRVEGEEMRGEGGNCGGTEHWSTQEVTLWN